MDTFSVVLRITKQGVSECFRAKPVSAGVWQLQKLNTKATYRVARRPDGLWSCSCIAGERWSDCKHLRVLRTLVEGPSSTARGEKSANQVDKSDKSGRMIISEDQGERDGA